MSLWNNTNYPYWSIFRGDVSNGDRLQERYRVPLDQVRGATITRTLNKPTEMLLTAETGISSAGKPVWNYFLPDKEKGRVVVVGGYANPPVGSNIVEMQQLDKTYKPVGPVLKGMVPRRACLFSGGFHLPDTAVGDTAGLITVTMKAKSAAALSGTGSKHVEFVDSLGERRVSRAGHANRLALKKKVGAAEVLQSFLTLLEDRTGEKVKADFSAVEGVMVERASSLPSCVGAMNVHDVLDETCALIGVAYRIVHSENGEETYRFMDLADAQMLGMDIEAPRKTALVLKYGEAVSNWSFNMSRTPIRLSGGKLTFTDPATKREVHFDVNKEEIRKELQKKLVEQGQGGADFLTALVRWMRDDPDAVILAFSTIRVEENHGPRQIPPDPLGGGRTITLQLNWPLPGLRPGGMVWFDAAGNWSVLPWTRRAYRLTKVVDVLDGKGRTYSQKLSCKG